MNILSISNFKNTSPLKNNKEQPIFTTAPKFGLTISKPLSKDTVSFGANLPTKKTCEDLKGACSRITAKKIIQRHEAPHQKNINLFLNRFKGIISEKAGEAPLTLNHRIKTYFSLQLKTASLGIGKSSIDEILRIISDVSGICIILEKPESYNLFVKGLNEMIKHGEINPIEVEYHRLPPKIKGKKLERTYDTLNPSTSQKLKNAIYKYKNPTYQLWSEVDSRSGYSGLHITLQNSDGTKTEVQVITRPIADLKYYENLYYKIRNGKPLDDKYQTIEPVLLPMKPLNLSNQTETEKAVQKALTKYSQEAYIYQIDNPHKNNFLKVSESKTLNAKEKKLIERFDFNKTKFLIDGAEKYAET